MRYPGFIGASEVSESPIASQQRTVNFYVEPVGSGGTTQAALYPSPGVKQFDEAPSGAGRAHFFQSSREFAVIGNQFVEIPETFSTELGTLPSPSELTVHGTVATNANPATISGNGTTGDELFITSGGNGYLFTLSTNTFAAIAALAGIATMGDYLAGYFLSLDASAAKLFLSDLLDGATWDPTQYIARTGTADGWVSMKVNEYVYLFGAKTSEIWYNSGAFPIPLELHPSGRIEYGIEAPFSVEVVGSSVVWLGATANGHGRVLRTAGFAVEVISDFATNYAFDQYSKMSDAIGDSYQESGHVFYLLTFPQADRTWAWDENNPSWCERSTWNPNTYEFEAWRGVSHAFAFGQHRFLDLKGPGVWRADTKYPNDFGGSPIVRMRIPPIITGDNKRIFYKRIELFVEAGLGLTTGQGSDPQVSMRWSDDGGKIWSPYSFRSAGAIGEYDKRVFWAPVGSGRKRTFEFRFADPIPWRILDAFIDAAPGSN